jgi:spermidine/putrescine-binding protein
MSLKRRSVLTTAAAAAAVSGRARAADTIVVTGYGGEYRDIMMETVIKPFEQKFSCQVTYDDTGRVDPYPRVRATKGSPRHRCDWRNDGAGHHSWFEREIL